MCYDSLFSQYPWLPDIKLIGAYKQRAAAMEAMKQTGSTEIALDSTNPKQFIFVYQNKAP